MVTKAGRAVAGTKTQGGRGGGGNNKVASNKVSGARNRSIKAISGSPSASKQNRISPKKISGGTKQQAGHLVKKQPQTTQGQRGKNGPAVKDGKRKSVVGTGRTY